MTSNVPDPNVPPASSPSELSPAPTPAPAGRKGLLLLVALVAGIIASGASWKASEVFGTRFQAGDPNLGPMQAVIDNDSLNKADAKNGAISYGIQGAVLGLLLGLAGGIARGSARGLVTGGVVGLVLGGALAALTSIALIPMILRHIDSSTDDLIQPLLAHSGLWAPIGAAAGLALGLGYGGGKNRMLAALGGGIAGAILGVIIYEVLGASVFPLDKTSQPVAASANARLAAHALLGIFASLGAALFAGTAGASAAKR